MPPSQPRLAAIPAGLGVVGCSATSLTQACGGGFWALGSRSRMQAMETLPCLALVIKNKHNGSPSLPFRLFINTFFLFRRLFLRTYFPLSHCCHIRHAGEHCCPPRPPAEPGRNTPRTTRRCSFGTGCLGFLHPPLFHFLPSHHPLSSIDRCESAASRAPAHHTPQHSIHAAGGTRQHCTARGVGENPPTDSGRFFFFMRSTPCPILCHPENHSKRTKRLTFPSSSLSLQIQ